MLFFTPLLGDCDMDKSGGSFPALQFQNCHLYFERCNLQNVFLALPPDFFFKLFTMSCWPIIAKECTIRFPGVRKFCQGGFFFSVA